MQKHNSNYGEGSVLVLSQSGMGCRLWDEHGFVVTFEWDMHFDVNIGGKPGGGWKMTSLGVNPA